MKKSNGRLEEGTIVSYNRSVRNGSVGRVIHSNNQKSMVQFPVPESTGASQDWIENERLYILTKREIEKYY